MTARHAPVLIIGSGPAGYTAAIYAARAMLKPVLIAGMQQGGQLMITTDVENYPGFADPIQGPWLMEQMLKQAEHVGTEIVNDLDHRGRSRRAGRSGSKSDSGTDYTADALIIATGAQAKWLGIPSEQTYQGFGVSACATCDGFFYRDKDVAVSRRRQFGGRGGALPVATSRRRVTVIHRRDEFRAERILQERLLPEGKRHASSGTRWSTRSPARPARRRCRRRPTGSSCATRRPARVADLPVDGVFVAIGHAPAVELFVGKLKQKPNGYLWTAPDSTRYRRAGRLRRRRRDRRHLPPGRDGGRPGLHGGARGGKVSGRHRSASRSRRIGRRPALNAG